MGKGNLEELGEKNVLYEKIYSVETGNLVDRTQLESEILRTTSYNEDRKSV